MNTQSTKTNSYGILLTDNVDMSWIKSITPQYHKQFCKFIVDTKSNKVIIGMDVHADGIHYTSYDNINYIYGGNIFFNDSHIVYESTLNIDKNLNSQNPNFDDPRIILSSELIEKINATLLSWVIL